MKIDIAYLADRPDLVPLISSWFFNQWGKNNPELTIEAIEESVKQRMNRNAFPLCLLGFSRNELITTISLKIREMETHPQYEHWLGNLYVLPKNRNQGVGSYMLESAVKEANRIGVQELYLYTRYQEPLYRKLGWEVIERVIYRGRNASIMKYRS